MKRPPGAGCVPTKRDQTVVLRSISGSTVFRLDARQSALPVVSMTERSDDCSRDGGGGGGAQTGGKEGGRRRGGEERGGAGSARDSAGPAEAMDSALESEMLAPAAPADAASYYTELAAAGGGPGLAICSAGDGKGKGLFACRCFEEGALVLNEPKLVGAQHTANKAVARVCSHCFRHVGSLRYHIARRLLREPDNGSDGDGDGNDSIDSHGDGGGTEDDERMTDGAELAALAAAVQSGALALPAEPPLPPEVPCPGGCADDRCAADAWRGHHCLLCTGPGSQATNLTALRDFRQLADSERTHLTLAPSPVPLEPSPSLGVSSTHRKPRGTNDIFHVAAQASISAHAQAPPPPLCSKGKKLVLCQSRRAPASTGRSERSGGGRGASEASRYAAAGLAALSHGAQGHAMALPADVSPEKELEFRATVRGLASGSLDLLRAAISGGSFMPLFSLQVYAHIIGMFELNNLAVVVPSPVEDYFLSMESLPPPEKDRDGRATLLALRRIAAGEEVTISYIDESAPWHERQVELADYGFACHCPRCEREAVVAA
eukprot:SM000169S02735  [mRNA]  locus=s169:263382:268557:- [translate_table: standard]